MNVLLDLDGTLTDPRVGIVGCIKHALNSLQLQCPSDAELARYIGPPLQESFRTLLNTTDPVRIDEAVALYRERFTVTGLFENTVYPGIAEALAALKAQGAVLYVATSKPTVYAVKIVEHFGLDSYFRAVYCSELDGTRSNKADLIAHILSCESVSPETAVMVGDRLHDMVGAKANGVLAVGVLWGYGSREELVTAGAASICASPATLCAVLSSMQIVQDPLTVRPYQRQDHDPLVALWNTVFPDDPPWNEPSLLLARKFTIQPELILLCFDGATLAGAVMAGFDGVRGWIYHLAVLPAARRRGIATRLMRAAESGLKKLGCTKVNLQVRATNAEVIGFYRAIGYDLEERASLGRRLD